MQFERIPEEEKARLRREAKQRRALKAAQRKAEAERRQRVAARVNRQNANLAERIEKGGRRR